MKYQSRRRQRSRLKQLDRTQIGQPIDVKPNRFYPFNNIADQVKAFYPDGMLLLHRVKDKDGRYRMGRPPV